MGKSRNRNMGQNPVTMPIKPVDAQAGIERSQSLLQTPEKIQAEAQKLAVHSATPNLSPASRVNDWSRFKEAPILNTIEGFLQDYVKHMATGVRNSTVTFNNYQVQLYRVLIMALKLQGTAFHEGWGMVLGIVAKHQDANGAFHEKNWGRFLNRVQLSSLEKDNYRSIMAIVTATADPRSRRVLYRQLSSTIDRLMASTRIPEVAERLHGFYEGI